MELNDYWYFVQVVEHKGFAAAGRALSVPKSRLSRHVQQLEDRLAVRLIQRSTRSFAVTDIGKSFYKHARAALDEAAMAEAVVQQKTKAIAGKVRISCSAGMAQYALKPLITSYLGQHDSVQIVQQIAGAHINLLEEGIDLAVRAHTGPLPDSGLIQRFLAKAPWHLFSSPSYLERVGAVEVPAHLSACAGLKLGWQPQDGIWNLTSAAGETVAVEYEPRICSDDMGTLKQAARDGLGIAALPAYSCRQEVTAGQLVRLLPDWIAGDAQISLILPTRKGIPPQVKDFADYLSKEFPAVTALDAR